MAISQPITNGASRNVVILSPQLTKPLDSQGEGAACGPSAIGDEFAGTPILRLLAHDPRWRAAQPFAGKRVLIALHLLPNQLGFLKAAMHLGLDPTLVTIGKKDYVYPCREVVLDEMNQWGFHDTIDVEQIGEDFFTNLAHDGSEPVLAIEDGGYFLPSLARNGLSGRKIIGGVEQTTFGVRQFEDIEQFSFPVVSIPHSRLKQEFEPPEIADGIVRSIGNLLPDISLAELRIAILGAGSIGRALVRRLGQTNGKLIIYDPDAERRLYCRSLACDVVRSAENAVHNADMVIGCAGARSVTPDVIANLKTDVWLVSASSADVEIDTQYLECASFHHETILPASRETIVPPSGALGTRYVLRPRGTVVNLIGDGRPVNFLGVGGMSAQAADLVMSLVLISAIEVAAGRYSDQRGVLEQAVNTLVAEYGICEQYERFRN